MLKYIRHYLTRRKYGLVRDGNAWVNHKVLAELRRRVG
jgi:hypothetical protein